ncbi:M20/M25/M40 family metallo-hydrolase [Nonomuraea rubra]
MSVVVGRAGRPAVAVRAELDGLYMEEQTGVAFAATNGNMHACGHDVHLAALVMLVRAGSSVRGHRRAGGCMVGRAGGSGGGCPCLSASGSQPGARARARGRRSP